MWLPVVWTIGGVWWGVLGQGDQLGPLDLVACMLAIFQVLDSADLHGSINNLFTIVMYYDCILLFMI